MYLHLLAKGVKLNPQAVFERLRAVTLKVTISFSSSLSFLLRKQSREGRGRRQCRDAASAEEEGPSYPSSSRGPAWGACSMPQSQGVKSVPFRCLDLYHSFRDSLKNCLLSTYWEPGSALRVPSVWWERRLMRRRWLGPCWKPLLGPAEVQRWRGVRSFSWLGGGD